jgi:hypothetical protein
VHAAVQAFEFGEVAHEAEFAVHKGVEQAHLYVGVGIQAQHQSIQANGVVVVEQQAHFHATVGCLHQGMGEQLACHIVVPNVVLQIQSVFGGLYQACARGKRIVAVG